MFVNVVFYDDQTGQVINTFSGDDSLIPDHVSALAIPQGVVIEDVRKWAVQNDAQGNPQLVGVTIPIETYEVNQERDRRVVMGRNFDLSAYGYATPIPVGGDPTTQTNLLGLALGVIMRNLLRDTNFQALLASDPTMTDYRDEANVTHNLNSLQMAMLWSLGASYVSDVFKHSWPLKSGTIPQDYENDMYWPSQA